MWTINLVFVLLFCLKQTSAASCPQSCDCVSDPALPSSQLVICNWTTNTRNVTIDVENVRSIQITCNNENNNSIPDTVFAQPSSIQHLSIEGCDLMNPVRMFQGLSDLRSLRLERVSQNGRSVLSLTDGSFESLSRLEKVKIVGSRLQRLPSDFFCHLKNLQVLNVSSNALTSLKQEKGCVASQLIIADISHNNLNKIHEYLHTFPMLRQLFVSYNKLMTLPTSSFESVVHLQLLDMEHNMLSTIEDLPDSLIHLNIAQNQFKLLPEAVRELPLLVSLNVSRNSLSDSVAENPHVSPILESVDMSHNDLRNIPVYFFVNSMSSLNHLHLEFNRIDQIPPTALVNCSSLLTLNLANNDLRVLKDDIFSGLQKLNSLHLQGNALDTIEQSVFVDLSIDELNLSGNRFTEAPHALGRLYRLKKLDLSLNKISKLYQFVFNKIPHLQVVNISHNELQSVGPYVFSDSEHLAQLDLSHNQISLIFRDSLSKCSQLRRLNLSHNRLNTYDDAFTVIPSLRHLDISFNRLTSLIWTTLPTKLEHLTASYNSIQQLSTTEGNINTKLQVVNLAGNQLTDIYGGALPQTLEELDVSNNRLEEIAGGSFSRLAQLRRVDLSKNRLKVVSRDAVQVLDGVQTVEIDLQSNPLLCSCEMDWIIPASRNSGTVSNSVKRRLSIRNPKNTTCQHVYQKRKIRVPKLSESDLLCDYDQVCEPDCVCCEYGNCDCKAVCPDGCNCFRDAVFKRNIIRCDGKQDKPFHPSEVPMSSTHVYLTGMNLSVIDSHTFLGRKRLEQLHINGSNVQQINSKAFNTLPSLKLVDLSDNQITQITGEEFHKTAALSHLFLNGNRLTSIEKPLLEKLPALQSLTLHKNQMIDLSPALMASKVLSVSLGLNPFRCDCSERFTAPHWIHANQGRVVDIDRVLCVENVTKAFGDNDTTILSAFPPNEGHDIYSMSMIEFFRDFNRTICVPITHGFFGQEPQNSILISFLIVGCLILLCAVLLVVSTIRKTHSAINQRRYKASSSLNCSSTAGSSPLPQPLLNYDAFVSYSKSDEKLVLDKVCRRLEDAEFSLRLLHRDGPTYNHRVHSISDELISQMDASQSLILVLTRNFLENEWKTLQIKTSHQLFAKNRNKKLIAVFIDDDVDQNLLDDELGQMLRKNTCLRLSDPLFWTLLRTALPSRVSPPPSDSSEVYSDLYGIVPSAMV
ncbi:unnamed protein product [Auanema sp. JU1783]|nr:unnamed protein product [Auanema sp. JU1783]